MSELFLVNPNTYNLSYEKLNAFANNVTSFALNSHLGVRFNDSEYFPQLTSETNMQNYFYVSDSFLHCNATFLDMCEYAYLSEEEFKSVFFEKFFFIGQLLKIIQKHGISNVEIFISEDGSIESENDFYVISATKADVLQRLYECVKSGDYLFPTIKITLSL